MKSLGFAALFAALLFTATPANAQFTVSISADESCVGLFSNNSGFTAALPCEMVADPGPGGLELAMTYDMFNPPGLVAGDLVMLEPDQSVSDIVRFNASSFTEGGSGSFVFYSAADGSSQADTGLPTANYQNIVTVTELDGGYVYTPTAGQPGFVAGAAGPVTYTFSSSNAAPEPASIALILGGLGFVAWKKQLFRRA